MKRDKRGPVRSLRDSLLYGITTPSEPSMGMMMMLQAMAAALAKPLPMGTGGSNRLRPVSYRTNKLGNRLLAQLDPFVMRMAQENARKRRMVYMHRSRRLMEMSIDSKRRTINGSA